MSFLRLLHTRSDGEVDTYHLKDGRRYRIGRGSACEVRILDVRMSRQHCALEYIDGHWTLLDIGSTNGIHIDGSPVDMQERVHAGMEISAGTTKFEIAGISKHLDAAIVATAVVEENEIDVEADENSNNNDHVRTIMASKKDLKQKTHAVAQEEKSLTDKQGEPRTMSITLLGRKVGPMSRSEARELKKKEIKGQLTEDDVSEFE